jgi:hypothetical protein
MSRACDNTNVAEWESAWVKKMTKIITVDGTEDVTSIDAKQEDKKNVSVLIRKDNAIADSTPVLCAFCGFSESYLMSPFVRGQTWQEWSRDFEQSKQLGEQCYEIIPDL